MLTRYRTFLRALVLLTAVLAGCAAKGPMANVTVITGPKNPEMAAIRSIAVVPFENDRSETFSRYLEAAISNVAVTDKSQSRQNTVAVVGADQTRALSRSLGEPASYAGAAKRLGVNAFLSGEVFANKPPRLNYKDKKTVCAQQSTKKDKKGREYQVCAKEVEVPIDCVKHTANVTANYRVTSAAGVVLMRESVQAEESDSACEGAIIKTPDELLATAYGRVGETIKEQVVPGERVIQVEWMTNAEGIRDAALKERFEGAIKFAGAGRADRACESFRELIEREAQSVALHYNVALCDEMSGQIETARQKYAIADKMLKAPNKMVSAALERVSGQVKTRDVIAEKRPDLLDSTAVPRTGPAASANPLPAQVSGIDPAMLQAMKAERRVALVIGNGKYQNVRHLRNAEKDARDVEAALKSLSFNVISGYNLNHVQTQQLLNRFKSSLRKGDVGLVYFAGHGISMDNSNLLLPVDFQSNFAKNTIMARTKALDVELAISPLFKEKGTRFSMIVADACREVPQIESASRSLARGLSAPKALPKGSVILYAAGANQVADDGAGDNGLFTKHFLKAIQTPNVGIKQSMEWIVSQVATETNGQQTPALYSESTVEFYFSIRP